MDKTTIQISRENHKKLKEISMSSKLSMDAVIGRLLKVFTKEESVDYDEEVLGLFQ